MNIKQKIREWLGTANLRDHLRGIVSDGFDGVRGLIPDAQKRPVLACVTVICDCVEDSVKPTITTMGGEAYVQPGGRVTIQIEPQRMTGNYTFFVSGHPDLLITKFNIGNDFKMSNCGAAKFGRVRGACEIGNRIYVEVEYREPA